jgi:hypothetical protein
MLDARLFAVNWLVTTFFPRAMGKQKAALKGAASDKIQSFRSEHDGRRDSAA